MCVELAPLVLLVTTLAHLLLKLLIRPIDAELLERVLLEVLEAVLIGSAIVHYRPAPTHNVQNTNKLGSLCCSLPTFPTETLIDHTDKPLHLSVHPHQY